MPKIQLAQVKEADALLSKDKLALMIGMVLDQQITIEKAFRGPYDLADRVGHMPTASEIAEMDPDKLAEIFKGPPALHRFPGSMAKRVQDFCQVIVDEYKGKVENIWKGVESGNELLKRIKKLPGFGEAKAKIFVALLGKQLDVTPKGWEAASKPYSAKGSKLSVADITDADSLAAVRASKQAAKAKAKAKK